MTQRFSITVPPSHPDTYSGKEGKAVRRICRETPSSQLYGLIVMFHIMKSLSDVASLRFLGGEKTETGGLKIKSPVKAVQNGRGQEKVRAALLNLIVIPEAWRTSSWAHKDAYSYVTRAPSKIIVEKVLFWAVSLRVGKLDFLTARLSFQNFAVKWSGAA